jgi:hypothetical protein
VEWKAARATRGVQAASSRLPLLPETAEVLSRDRAVVSGDGGFVLFDAAGPIDECREDDEVGMRLGAALAASLGLAPVTAVAAVFGVHRATVHRDQAKLEEGGVRALQPEKRGPKGPHELTPTAVRGAQRAPDSGESATADIIPDHRAGRLTVRFPGLASPSATRAIAGPCALLNSPPT